MTFLLSLLFALPTFAAQLQDTEACQNRVERGGTIQVQMSVTAAGACYVSVDNYKKSNLIYRSYLFANDGNLMVFNSFGDGPVSESTGAREIYTFPHRLKNPTYHWNEELRRLEVTTTTGDQVYFSYETGEIIGMDKAQVTVADSVNPNNNGGITVTNYKGLMYDAGFTVGQAPTQVSSQKGKFIDETGKSCEIKVGEIFSYTGDGDPFVKYNDKQLANFLKKRCPKLKFPAN